MTAFNRSIFGLSRAGFRVADVVSTPGLVRLTSGVTAKVDLNSEKVQNLIYSERDNFIRTVDKQTFTVTIAAPGVVTATAHGLITGDILKFTTTGALPTGLVVGTKYHVIKIDADTFWLATSHANAIVPTKITTTGSQSGTHTFQQVSANIVGLDRRGFRVTNTAGSPAKVKIGSVVQVDLTDYKVLRQIRRNKELWFVSTSASSVIIRGLVNPQRGFDLIKDETIALTGSNAGNATNAKVVIIGGKTYTIKTNLTEAKATNTITTSGTPASVRATGTITTSGTGAANNDTVTVGSVTYTFKSALTGAANEVLRDGTEDNCLTNLKKAINAESGIGVNYGTGTVVNPDVTCGAVTVHAVTLTAKSFLATVGNALPLSRVGAPQTVSGATLTGGTNETVTLDGQAYTFVEALDPATPYEVLINGQDTSLTNLAAAITGSAGSGSTYGAGTVASTKVTSSAVSSHAITLTALVVGTAANAYTLAVSGSHLARGAATFAGGIAAIANEVHIGGSADATLTNLVEAINAGANVGVDYSTGTTANAVVTASGPTAHVVTFTEVTPGFIDLTFSTNEATYSFGSESGGIQKVYQGVSATVNPSLPQNFKQLRRHFKSWVTA